MDLMLTLAADRIILVTDAMSAAGGKDARYKIGDLDVNVAGGVATLVSNGSLAGSTLTMDSAHDRLVREHGVSEAITRSATMELGKKALRI
jgi:N-acetylglucosamine-6-phosphate deacetylase